MGNGVVSGLFESILYLLRGLPDKMVSEPRYRREEEISTGDGYSVVHVTCYKERNAGDTVLSQCVRRTLRELCGISSFKLVYVRAPVTEEIVELINSHDAVVIGGGGLFLPDSNKNKISGWQWAVPEDLLARIKVPVLVYAVGYNYFRGQSNDALFESSIRALSMKSSLMGLRNSGSCRAINSIIGGGDSGYLPALSDHSHKTYIPGPSAKACHRKYRGQSHLRQGQAPLRG